MLLPKTVGIIGMAHFLSLSMYSSHSRSTGAGPAGLASAKAALEAGLSPRVFESAKVVGGMWSQASIICPSMRTNLSKYTCCFSDFPWPSNTPIFPTAAQVGEYLSEYAQKYLKPETISLGCRVLGVDRSRTDKGWSIIWSTADSERQETATFDYLIISCGFFSEPFIPPIPGLDTFSGSVIHSSSYSPNKGDHTGKHVAIIGSSFSAVEVADDVSLRAASVHHIIPRPFWVLPRYLPMDVQDPGTTFLPLDLVLYRRLRPEQTNLSPQQRWARINGYLRSVCGDLSSSSDSMKVDMNMPPYVAVSDMYANSVLSGRITLHAGHLASISGSNLNLTSDTSLPPGITHLIFATGFRPSSVSTILPPTLLSALNFSPTDRFIPFPLDRATLHTALPNAAFVGHYRGPYWGVIELQARWCAGLFSGSLPWPSASEIEAGIAYEEQIRNHRPKLQFPRGDYVEFCNALAGATKTTLPEMTHQLEKHIVQPQHIFVPQNFGPSPWMQPCSSPPVVEEPDPFKSLEQVLTRSANCGLFVAAAVFRFLQGTWLLNRTYVSRRSDHPSGSSTGSVEFIPRKIHRPPTENENGNVEYLYSEKTEMIPSTGPQLSGTRQYIYRYNEPDDALDVFFAERGEEVSLGRLFHRLKFEHPPPSQTDTEVSPWIAKASHFCSPDTYEVAYTFFFDGADLAKWQIEYEVRGPKKDYSMKTWYSRDGAIGKLGN